MKRKANGRNGSPGRDCQLYELFFKTARDIVLFVRYSDGRITKVNEAAVRAYGYTREELLSMTIHDLRAPETRPLVAAQMTEAATKGISFEALHQRKDGSTFPVDVSSIGTTVAGERILLSIIRDITERERAQEALRESEEKFHSFVNYSGDGIVLVDQTGHIVEWNIAEEHIAGLRREKVLGQPLWEVQFRLSPKEQQTRTLYEHSKAYTLRILQSGQLPLGGRSQERTINRPDGTQRIIQATIFPVKTAKGFIIGSITRDVTDRRRIEAEREQLLDEAQRRAAELDATINAIAGGVMIYGAKGDLVRLNQRAQSILSLTPEELGAMTLEEHARLLSVEDARGRRIPTDETPTARALRGETATDRRLTLHPPNAATVHVLASAAPIRNPQGQIVGAVLSFADITQLVELQRLRDEVTSVIAHDLRQPLTTVQGQAQLVKRALDVNRVELARKSSEAIITSSRRMAVMIKDLVDSVRMEAGQLRLARQPLSLGQFLSELLIRSSESLETDRVKLLVEKDMPPALADLDRLERIVLNQRNS